MSGLCRKPSNTARQLLLSIISEKTGKQFGNITPAKISANINIEGLDETPAPKKEVQAKVKTEVAKESVVEETQTDTLKAARPDANTSPTDDDVFDDILEGLDV